MCSGLWAAVDSAKRWETGLSTRTNKGANVYSEKFRDAIYPFHLGKQSMLHTLWLIGYQSIELVIQGLSVQSLAGAKVISISHPEHLVELVPRLYSTPGGGRVVRSCWVNFQCLGVLLIWIIVGQGPIALAVGAGGGCLDIFTLTYPFSSFSLSLGDGPI